MTLKSHALMLSALANKLGANKHTLKTLNRRSSEGLHFFCVVLPSLGKDLDSGLQGRFVLSPDTFFSLKNASSLPVVFNEFFIKIFDRDGYIRVDPCYTTIKNLRQLLYLFYKLTLPFTPAQLSDGEEKFRASDESVKTDFSQLPLASIRKRFCSLFPYDPMDIGPRHSSGATADRYDNEQRIYSKRYIPSLMKVYGAEWFFNNTHHVHNWTSINDTISLEPNARMTFVPKDSRGPRVICIEPHERMFIQQGLMRSLYDYTETCSPAKGYINFTNQDINGNLAYKGSISQSYATIDLKDASDMVSYTLLRYITPADWFAALDATRSKCIDMPSGSSIQLKKFAPMGSALCFPIEAFLFWSIAREVCPQVWVYGDDIIVPNQFYDKVTAILETYGLIVNQQKSLNTGLFRESCGYEFYAGYDISYIKFRSYDLVSFYAFLNLIAEKYDTEIADELCKIFEMDRNIVLFRDSVTNRVARSSLVFYTKNFRSRDVFFRRRYNKDIQLFEYRRLVETASSTKSKPLKKTMNYRCTDDDLLYDWHCGKTQCSPLEADITKAIGVEFLGQLHAKQPNALDVSQENLGLTKSRLQFSWVPFYGES